MKRKGSNLSLLAVLLLTARSAPQYQLKRKMIDHQRVSLLKICCEIPGSNINF